jgi:CRP-like cAMP-binding protein
MKRNDLLAAVHLLGPFERLVLLKSLSLSAEPPPVALASLAQQAVERHVGAGAPLGASDSGPWAAVHVVVEGRVSVFQDGVCLYRAGPGQPFGLVETLARTDAEAVTARADVETVTLEIRRATLLSVMEDHHAMALDATRDLARRLLQRPAWLIGLSEQRARRFTATRDLDLVDRITRLQSSEFFAQARVDSLAEVVCHYEEFQAPAGTVLWKEGDSAQWLLVLLAGIIDCGTAAGLRFHMTAGTDPGLFEALADAARWHDATTATPISGFRLRAERIVDAVENDFAMAEDVMAALASMVRSSTPPAS